ncbi:MAG TPA: hypothetical protein VNV25_01355 [Gemmatimonadaceae bacterium]|jgi:hypothetical protein|nr:hypothetical protein [Gemmatimonadaceae bacterium]
MLQAIVIGHAVVALNGPWRFHVGDDPRWADPAFDDTHWEVVDLTPRPGARDPDVGLPGYVPGWGASGVAWYRLHVTVTDPANDTLALGGPPDVDEGYDLYVNGTHLGHAGAPYSIQPRYFVLAPLQSATIAIRVWAAPGDDGGIHIAPAIGEINAVRDQYALQWSRTLWGYIVDGIEPLAFVLLAVLALALRQSWMTTALVLSAMLRVNQVTFYWGQFETAGFAETLRTIIVPLIIGAWIMAWRAWFGVRRLSIIVVDVIVALMYATSWARILAALVMLAILVAGRRQWLAVIAAVLVSIGLFAPELSALHIAGIWFPFGVGVSRTQYAYAAFDLVLFALLAWTTSTSLRATSHSTS